MWLGAPRAAASVAAWPPGKFLGGVPPVRKLLGLPCPTAHAALCLTCSACGAHAHIIWCNAEADRVPPLPLLTHAPPSSLQCIPVIARVGRGPARAACAPARERGR